MQLGDEKKKRKILFVISTLRCGGAEHALVSLLNKMDYQKYDVDLLVLCETGMFYKEKIPKEVYIISPHISLRGVLEPTIKNYIKCFLRGEWKIIAIHIKRIIDNIIETSPKKAPFWSYYWAEYGRMVRKLDKQYDVAIGYLEGLSIYYCVDKVLADRKIGWVHTNYVDSKQNRSMDEEYFDKLDRLVTMSEPASETLANVFPQYRDKINTIHNTLDEKEVLMLSEENVKDVKEDFAGTTIVSVGNILPVKGYDLAIEACEQLVQAGKKIRWLVIGRKDQAKQLEEMISEKKLGDIFILMGMKSNPYKYMRLADVYVQCSRYEGFSTTIREAKLLLKPIVATNCQGINDQIQNQKNGTLVEINAENIFMGILDLIENPDKQNKYERQLEQERLLGDETEREMKKLYQLLD